MGDSIKLFGGGDNGNRFHRVAVPKTNEQRRSEFTSDYNNAFGNNARFQESLRGFYGNEPFDQIIKRITETNAFQRPVKQFKMVPSNQDDDGLLGNPFIPPDIQFGMVPLSLF